MSLRPLVRIGKRWVNPWFIVEVDPNEQAADGMLLTLFPGTTRRLTPDEEDDMRRLLGEPARSQSGASNGGPPGPGDGPAPAARTHSGYSPTHPSFRPAGGQDAAIGQ